MRDLVAEPAAVRGSSVCARQFAGVLHATAVCDRSLAVELHPDGGGQPMTVVFRPDQGVTIRAALCRQVTLVGVLRLRAGRAGEYLDLHRIVTITAAGP